MARVLIMEDDEQVRSVFTRTIESGGHEVEEASEGKTGTQMFRDQPADLVIVDILMPEQEGLETISKLKADFPDAKILAISGGGRITAGDYLKIARSLGAARTLEKPIDPPALLEAVNDMLGDNH